MANRFFIAKNESFHVVDSTCYTIKMVCHTYSENFPNSKIYSGSSKGGKLLKIKIDINDDYEETEITIHARKWTKELEEFIQKLEKPAPK